MGIDQLTSDAQTLATRLIRRKARQIAARDNFTPSDKDDIAQDLWLHLIERIDKFDAEKGTIFAFIVTVVERKAASILRHQAAAKRDVCRCSSLNLSIRANDGTRVELASTITEDAPNARLGKRTLHPQRGVEMVIDVTEFVETLPAELKELCERLRSRTLSEIARETGVPRSTLYERIKKLREYFEEAGLREYL